MKSYLEILTNDFKSCAIRSALLVISMSFSIPKFEKKISNKIPETTPNKIIDATTSINEKPEISAAPRLSHFVGKIRYNCVGSVFSN